MNTSSITPNPPATRNIRLRMDAERSVYWMSMHASKEQRARPCCTLPIIEDGIAIQEFIGRLHRQYAPHRNVLGHLVLASEANVFSLGGDLALFSTAIREGNRAPLLAYALKCAQAVYGFQNLADGAVHSIALIQGDALGGGFEVALSCNTIVAEDCASLGFPEALFGLFPGMGAYSFLRRRISAVAARKMVLDARLYSAHELQAMGIVDVVVPKGAGVEAVESIISARRRCAVAYQTVGAFHAKYDGVPLDELEDITIRWVDTALALGEKGLQTMERILRAQARRFNADESEPTDVLPTVIHQ